MISLFPNLFGGREKRPRLPREILRWEECPAALYAIGDVHGCWELLHDLERQILEDARSYQGDIVIVYLGDLVDRGPDTARIIDHVSQESDGSVQRVVLCGNHEAMFLDFLEAPSKRSPWLEYGGLTTLLSYGIDIGSVTSTKELKLQILGRVPDSHRAFFAKLPIAIDMPGYFLAHAGIDPDKPLKAQTETDLIWGAPTFIDHAGPFPKCIVHGHTPLRDVAIGRERISVDTGAYATGTLSAVRLVPGEEPKAIRANYS